VKRAAIPVARGYQRLPSDLGAHEMTILGFGSSPLSRTERPAPPNEQLPRSTDGTFARVRAWGDAEWGRQRAQQHPAREADLPADGSST
jgi:hypothetical protein